MFLRRSRGDEPVDLPLAPTRLQQTAIESMADGSYQLQTTGIDSFLEFDLGIVDRAAELSTLAFEYFSLDGISRMELRLAAAEGAWTAPLDAGSLSIAQGWAEVGIPLSEPGNELWKTGQARRLRIDFGEQPGRVVRLRKMRLRGPTAEELRRELERAQEEEKELALASRIEDYFDDQNLCNRSLQVALEASSVVLEGRGFDQPQSLWLLELGIEQYPFAVASDWRGEHVEGNSPTSLAAEERLVRQAFPLEQAEWDGEGNFSLRLPLQPQADHRLLSRWQVVRWNDSPNGDAASRIIPLTHARYAVPWEPPKQEVLPPLPPVWNRKGLNGVSSAFGLEQLAELGVEHLALNVVLTDLLDEAAIDGAESFDSGGKTWWVRPGRLEELDQMVRFGTEHQMTVAAILLIPQRSRDSIVHPGSTSAGIYAMPNLVDREGAAKYVATIDLLTARYSGQTERGRIDHWIVHNEVDFGWIWTNMGAPPLEVYLETYLRSMRIVSLLASRSNPQAITFISLTHHWDVPEDPRQRSYPPRKMLERMVAMLRAEGDFRWGVAAHPYPENLFDPRPWADPSANQTFATPRITMKNIEVLKRFLSQREFLDGQGRLRPVLLSEQGYHTAGYSREAQELQGAALLYTWQRLRETNFVLAFDYHRWVDSPDEGGLLLGLRTVPSPEQPAGEKKLGWDVYRDIGTPAEAPWRAHLEKLYRGQGNPSLQSEAEEKE